MGLPKVKSRGLMLRRGRSGRRVRGVEGDQSIPSSSATCTLLPLLSPPALPSLPQPTLVEPAPADWLRRRPRWAAARRIQPTTSTARPTVAMSLDE